MNRATIFRATRLDNLLVFKARYTSFQFTRHAHEDFALGLMESGVQQFYCRGRNYEATPGDLITVNAGEMHDGKSGNGQPYTYKIIYLPESLVESLGKKMVTPLGTHAFCHPVTHDWELAQSLRHIFALLECDHQDPVEVQSEFYTMVAQLLRRHGVAHDTRVHNGKLPSSVIRGMEYIADMAGFPITLKDIARAAGASRFHFLRQFNTTLGITPHKYLVLRRLEIGRESLRKGHSIADAALEACFTDQAHFSRSFKAAFGITPGQYRKAVS